MIIPTNTHLYFNNICACGNDFSNEGNTDVPLIECRECTACRLLTECTNCHSVFLISELDDGQCNECISLIECEECHSIDEILYDGLCRDCIVDINNAEFGEEGLEVARIGEI